MSRPSNTPARDRAWGRWYARRGTSRVLREAYYAPPAELRESRYYAAAAGVLDPRELAARMRHGATVLRVLDSIVSDALTASTAPWPALPSATADDAELPPALGEQYRDLLWSLSRPDPIPPSTDASTP